jgi:hypothetical protein
MRKWIIGAVTVLAVLALGSGSVLATLGPPQTSTKTKGVTTITWDSSFQDLGYTLGNTIDMTVTWTVEPPPDATTPAGRAEFVGFELRRGSTDASKSFTPKSKKDPALGTLSVGAESEDATTGGSVPVQLTFTKLHLDQEPDPDVDIGNAKLKLYLMVDTDGSGAVDTLVGYGVNVHVEDPQ